eukprot:1681295-Rhodomonas_salina.1
MTCCCHTGTRVENYPGRKLPGYRYPGRSTPGIRVATCTRESGYMIRIGIPTILGVRRKSRGTFQS